MKCRKYALLIISFLIPLFLVSGVLAGEKKEAKKKVAPPPNVGTELGKRFHNIHTTKLKLDCAYCHGATPDTYNDPLAQTFYPTDKRACLSCHKEGGRQPFYGTEWNKAKVKLR